MTLDGTGGLQSVTITVTLPSGSVQKSYGSCTLPQTALVELPDQALSVMVGAQAVATDGSPRVASGSVTSQPHHQVTLSLPLGGVGDGGVGDGGADGNVVAGWTSAAASGPAGGRHSVKMVWDSAHQQMVSFGGVDSNGVQGGTFTWDGTTWTKHTPSGPGPRQGYGLTWDSDRQVVVLFSGVGTGGEMDDIWEYDGVSNAWVNKTPSTGALPWPVHAAAIAYHKARHKTVIYGGWSSTHNANPPDTWEWDGTSFTLQTVATHPPTDNAHALVYDEARQAVLYFSGRDNSASTVEVWAYDVNGAWSKLTPASPGPSRRRTPAVAWDPVRQVTVLFGGFDNATNKDLNDTWELGSDWVQRNVAGAPARRSAAMAYDALHGQVVVFGGGAGRNMNRKDNGPSTFLADTWVLGN